MSADGAPRLLRIPHTFHSVDEVLGAAKQLELENIVVLSERRDGGLVSGRLGMNKGRLTSLVRLSYLGPEIVRALLAGSQSNALTPSRLLRLSKNLPHDWKEQRCFLGFAA